MVRVLVAGFKHETNTFARQPTDLDAFRARALVYGAAVGKAFAGTQTEIAAYLDFCATRGWQAVTPVYADASPGGPVTEDAFRHVADTIVDAARDQGPFDAVLLALHGAMVCAHTDDGEGTLLDELRGVVGPGVPVAATLDLHANVTDRMAAGANVLVAYRTYPHIDQAETATRAATIVERALAGRAKPTTTVRRGAMLEGLDGGQTIAPGPMTEALGRADRMLQQPGVLAAGVCAGFVKADTPETGPSAYVVGDGADPRFGALADELMKQAAAQYAPVD
ncbi:MAG: M81 family metallopeptidase, partial [Rhodospirillaceae bacterium]